MLDVGLIFKIGACGILLIILDKVFDASGRKELATISNLTGIVIILVAVIGLISRLFGSVRTLFTL